MTRAALSLPLPTPELVMFDLDYTLLRPSDQFEAPGYVRGRASGCVSTRRAGRRRSAPPTRRPASGASAQG
jgi:hypothetical protein